MKADGTKYYEYVLCYVDDMFIQWIRVSPEIHGLFVDSTYPEEGGVLRYVVVGGMTVFHVTMAVLGSRAV